MTHPCEGRERRRAAARLPATLALGLAASMAAAGQADAAGARIFRLPAEPVDRALLRFGVQGVVSVGGLPAPGCSGVTHPVLGLMTPAHALARLLPSGCGFEQLDARTFRIVGRPHAQAAKPAPTPVLPGVPPGALDELIVTAEKRPEPLIGSPSPVSALPAAEVRRLGGTTFAALASQMVGVTITNLGPGRDKILVRGLSDGVFNGATQSTVGIYLDDAPITYNAPDPDLRLADIERIEVLRGPQGTLYGSGSMGGVVHIVTASPDPHAVSGSIAAGGAFGEQSAPSSSLEAMLNLPLAEGAAARAVVYTDLAGGYLDNPGLRLSDSNRSRRWGGRVSLLGALPDGWRARFSMAHQAIDTSDAQYTRGGAGSLVRSVQVREPSDNDFTEAALNVSRAGQAADLRISAAFVDHVLQSQYDATGAFPAVLPPAAPAAFDQDQKVSLGVLEAVATSSQGGHTRWLAGLFASEAREVDKGALAVEGAGRSVSVYRRRDRLQEAAVYGEAGYDLTNRLTLTAGVRWFATHRSSHASDFGLAAPPLSPADSEVTDRGVAPKLRASYAFAPDLVVYAQAQKGYRAGGFNLPAAAAGPIPTGTAPPLFKGDSLWSYEAGGVLPLFERRLTLRLAAFHVDWHRLQTDQFLPSGLPVTVNIGDGVDSGVEAEALWRGGSHWQVRLNALLDDGQIIHLSGAFPARTDVGLPGVPSQLESADVLYRWTPRNGLQASVSLQASYVGRSHVTFQADPSTLMGGYAVARLAAELAADRWRLRTYIDNLTNERGDSFAFGNPFSRSQAPQVTPLRPRTAGLELTWSF